MTETSVHSNAMPGRQSYACVERLLQDAVAAGIPITLVGSLARDTFGHHADIDLLVRGPPSPRADVERLVADYLRENNLVYEADIGSDGATEQINGVEASRSGDQFIW